MELRLLCLGSHGLTALAEGLMLRLRAVAGASEPVDRASGPPVTRPVEQASEPVVRGDEQL